MPLKCYMCNGCKQNFLIEEEASKCELRHTQTDQLKIVNVFYPRKGDVEIPLRIRFQIGDKIIDYTKAAFFADIDQ